MSIKSEPDFRPLREARRPWTVRPRMDVHQYALGLMRVGQDSSVGDTYITNNQTTTEIHSFEVIIITEDSGHTPGEQSDYPETAWIYLPEDGCLIWNGMSLPVQPVDGLRQTGKDYYEVPQPSDIWCGVIIKRTGGYEARLYEAANLPESAVFKFHVATIPPKVSKRSEAREGADTVSYGINSFAYGLVACNSGFPAPFDPITDTDGAVTGFKAGYVQVGGFTISVSGSSSLAPTEGFVCVEVNCASSSASGASVTGTLVAKGDLAALQAAQQNLDKITIPLFKMTQMDDEGEGAGKAAIELDMRRMPSAGMLETYLGGAAS